jgi:hypothetical protein
VVHCEREGLTVRTLETLGGVVVLVGAAVFFSFGTLSPCGVLRETVRQRDGLAAILPDSVVDLAIAGQYGALSPGRCLGILLEQRGVTKPAQASLQQAPQTPRPQPSPQQSTADNPLVAAFKQTEIATDLCGAKRLSGELPSHAASVQCANPAMIQAFNAAHYKYMDLIQFFAAKRLELAGKIDRGEITEQQGQVETQNIYASIQATERQRDAAR